MRLGNIGQFEDFDATSSHMFANPLYCTNFLNLLYVTIHGVTDIVYKYKQ